MPEMSANDFSAIAQFIQQEHQRRVGRRRNLDMEWREIDRQIDMTPIPAQRSSGQALDWYPNVEEPLQFNAIEVIGADVMRMMFPKGAQWFEPSSELSEEYAQRFADRREQGINIIPGGQERTLLDQVGADAFVKAAMDHYHRLYDFRGNMSQVLMETIRYGTGIARVRELKAPEFLHSHRGTSANEIKGPAVIPTSIKNTYLDDTPQAMMHEGTVIAPSPIRTTSQLLEDLKRAARTGDGYLPDRIALLKPKKDVDRRGIVELIEFEGDLLVPKSQGSIFLPNYLITVAVGAKGPEVVRMRINPSPRRSLVPFFYMKTDAHSIYGTTPLMAGRPVQEAASFALNDLLAHGRFKVMPPVFYDRNDPNFAAGGGPDWFPGAMNGVDAPDRLNIANVGESTALLQSYLTLIKRYEDVVGVNDPRRGAQVRSHTTTGAHQLEAQRGITRTVDFAQDVAAGPMTTVLYMEYDIIRKVLKTPQSIPVDSAGMEGWINIAAADLPDRVMFRVSGADGVAEEQEKTAAFFAATQQAVQLAQAAAEAGKPVDIDFLEIITELYNRAGIQNAGKFVRAAQAAPGAATSQPGVPSDIGPDSASGLAEVVALLGGGG